MRFYLLILALIPFVSQSQMLNNTDDYFSISNPSAFAEKRVYATGFSAINSLHAIREKYVYLFYKQQISKLSVGINTDFQSYAGTKTLRGAIQVAYPWRITRNLMLNSGVAINATRDNLSYSTNDYPVKFQDWNPAYYGLDAGVSLLARNWNVGFSVSNFNQEKRIIDTFKLKTDLAFNFNGSVKIKLDSLSNFSLVPSLFVQQSTSGYLFYCLNLKFNFYSHSIGVGYMRRIPSLFYQYNFKNGLSIGASLGQIISLLGNSNVQLNGSLRVNYQLKRRYRCGFAFYH